MPSRQDLSLTLANARRELQQAQMRVAELEAQLSPDQPNHTDLAIVGNAYHYSLDVIPAGCQIIDFDWRYLYINDAATRYEGHTKEEFLGYTMMARHPGIEKTPLFAVLQRCMRERNVARIENEVPYPEGGSAWFELFIQPVPEGIFILSLDITERKQTELALLAREQQFKLFVEHAPAALAMLDSDMRYLLVSRRWLTDYRLGEANVIGRSHYDLFPELPAQWKAMHQRCLAGAVESSDADPFLRADGSLDWVRWEIRPWQKIDGAIGGLWILSEIITERKHAEENIRKLHRTLGVLSDINQSIVRIRHLPSLFEKACEIAVEKGTFRMAWLGLFNAKTNRIDPVAHAGIANNDLENLMITLNTEPLSNVLRAGERLICNDIQNDPRWRLWREEALRGGYKATVALPLIVAGETRGIFNLYAGETDFFDEQEMRLMDEMAGDISFAIEFAEQDEKRLNAEAAVQQYAKRMEILHQIDRGIINANSTQAIIAATLKHIRQLVPCQRANVGLIDMAKGEGVIFAVDYAGETALTQGLRVPIREDFFEGYDARYVKVVPDLRDLQEINPHFKQAVKEGLRSGINVILRERDQSIGTLGLFANTPNFFTAEHQEIIFEVGNQLAIAIRQMRLSEELAQYTSMLEQKVAERTADLQATLVRVEAILTNSPDSILLVSSDLTIQQTNASFDRLFASVRDAYLGESLLTLFHPDDANNTRDFFHLAATQQTGSRMEIRAIRQDNTAFDAELTIGVIKDDGLVCIIRDITERKAQDRQLRYHAALQENVSDAVIVTDMALRIQSWNEAAVRTYGWTAAEAVGKVAPDFLYIRFPVPPNPETALKQFNEQRSLHHETIQQRKDGTDIFILGSVTRLDDEKGVPFGIIAINRDITERKAQERQLRYHASIQESVSDAVIATDMQFHVQSWNRAAETIYGWSAAEMIGKPVGEILQTTYASAEERTRILQDFLERGAWEGEVTQRHRDGRIRYIHASTNLFKDEMGQPFGVVSVNRDITERKRAEQRYHALFEQAHDAVFLVDMQGKVLDVNQRAAAMLGYNIAELRMLSYRELSDEVPQSQALIRQLLAGETVPMYERVMRKKDGSRISVEISVEIVRDLDGNPLHIQSVVRDISERKRAEEALRESEGRYRLLAENIADVIMTFSLDRLITYMSPSCERLLGYLPEEVEGRSHSEYIHPEDYPQVINRTRQAVAAKENFYTNQFRLRHKAGHYIWYEVRTRLIFNDHSGNGVQFISVLREITDRKHAEEALQNKMAEERQFQVYLKALHEIIIELTGIDQLDTFYKRAVELGRERLGFERLAMFLYNERDDTAVGTYGTDIQGNLVDERGVCFTPDPNGIMQRSFDRVERFYLKEETTLYNEEVAVGYGWNAAAVLWNGARNLGWFVADNLLSHTPPAKPLLDTMGLYALSVGTLLAQKQTQLAHKESEALYRLLAENITDLIMRTTLTGECLYVSPSVQTLLGYTPEELISQPMFHLIHPDDQPIIWEAYASALERKDLILPHQYRAKHKEGHYIWVETVGKPIFNEASNEIHGVITSSRDVTRRRQSEEALRESEEKFRLLLDAAPVATIISDQTGRISLVNMQAENLLGYSRDELTGQMVEIVVPDLVRDSHGNHRLTYVTTPRVRPMGLGMALYAKRKDGSEVPVEIELSYVETRDGLMVMSFIMDITERKRVAAELEQQRAFLRNVIDVSPNMIYVKDYDGRFVLVNPPVATIYNTTIDTVIGKTDADFNPTQKEVEDYLAADRLVITSGKRLFVEEPITGPTGKVHWLQTTKVPIVSADGQSKYVLGVSTDITERKEAEEALRSSEEKYRLLVETMHGGLAVFDTEFRVTFVNDRFCELLGYSRAEVIGKQLMNFMDAADIPIVQSQIKPRQSGESTSYELPLRHKDGHQLHLLLSGSPLLDKQGKYTGSIVVATDISIQKQAEVTLRLALAREKDLGDLKTRFVSMASHEFRTPLATILALVETLSAYRHKLSEEQIEQRFDKIKGQVDHLKDIMEDVLLLARMQERRVEFNPVKLDLDDLLRGVLDEFESRAADGHRLEYIISGTSRAISLDHKLMRQIISNLVSNAIKYSSKGKIVRIHLEYTDAEVILQVSDEGIGIPEADLPHLFEPFHRAANVGTISGTGLGLVITREAVELHSGTITVESQQGVGTTFLIRIPISAGAGQKSDKPPVH